MRRKKEEQERKKGEKRKNCCTEKEAKIGNCTALLFTQLLIDYIIRTH